MLNGKGFFIWQIPRVEGGNPATIASTAKAAGLSYIIIKIADGINAYNVETPSGKDLVPPVVNALRAQGIEAWGWHYVYGDDPVGEANKAVQRIQQTGVSGYVIDAELDYEKPGRAVQATAFMNQYRSLLPVFPTALSSFRYPTAHPGLPWLAFLNRCDYAMPQVYWVGATDPTAQLMRSLGEYRALTTL